MAKGKLSPKVATTSKNLEALFALRDTGLNDGEDDEPPRRAPRHARQISKFDLHMQRLLATTPKKRKA